ncbi:MAG: hypothetical protein WCE26_25160, partial [Candidatus Acidiferrales bacterium]
PLLRRNVAEHVILLLIGSSHATLDASRAAPLQNFRVFQQPASTLLKFPRQAKYLSPREKFYKSCQEKNVLPWPGLFLPSSPLH